MHNHTCHYTPNITFLLTHSSTIYIITLATFSKFIKCQYLLVLYLLISYLFNLCLLVLYLSILYLPIYICPFYLFYNTNDNIILFAQSDIFFNIFFNIAS